MSITVFYAWQSDRGDRICRYFIRDAVNDALKEINAKLRSDAAVEEAPAFPEVVLDHDTKGVPGIPKVADTIQRKISECDVFLADVTHVADYVTADGRAKTAQNGNVLLELGQALKEKSPERILLVMNTAFGTFESLPFDLHLHRQPLRYDLPDATDKDRLREAKIGLTRMLVEALGMMISEITKNTAAARAKSEAEEINLRRQQAKQIRAEFEERVQKNAFQMFRSETAVMTLCLIPLVVPSVNVDLGRRENEITLGIIPFSGGGWDHSHDPEHYTMFLPAKPGQRVSPSVTAIKSDCSIFAADVLRMSEARWYEKVRPQLEWEGQERQVIKKTADYLQLMRRLGIGGPVFVGLSLLRVMDHVLLGEGRRFVDNPRINETEVIRPPEIELPAALDGRDEFAVAREYKPIFDYIWRAAGALFDPYFDKTGNYRLNE